LTNTETISFLKGLSAIYLKDGKIFGVVACITSSAKNLRLLGSYKYTDSIMSVCLFIQDKKHEGRHVKDL